MANRACHLSIVVGIFTLQPGHSMQMITTEARGLTEARAAPESVLQIFK